MSKSITKTKVIFPGQVKQKSFKDAIRSIQKTLEQLHINTLMNNKK